MGNSVATDVPWDAEIDLAPLPAGWEYVPLADLVEEERPITYGIVQPGADTPAGVPIVRVQDIKNGRVDTSSPLRVDPAIAAKYRRTTLHGGELLLTLVGTVGEAAIAPPEVQGWNTARAVAVVPVRRDIGARFVQYAIRTPPLQHLILAWCTTTVQATFNLKEANQLPIPLPPPAEREAIVRILRVLDDKIELNRRINQTLEALARAMFKSWFVDFDPVVAKAAGKKPVGMSPQTAALFPDRFQDSALGPIPKGWRVAKLRDLCEFAYGKALPESKRSPGPIPVYGSDGVTGWHNSMLVRGPGIVIGRKGNAGKVNWSPDDFFPIDTTFFVDRAAARVPLSFLFYMLGRLDLPNLSADSAVPGLNREMAHGLDVIHPAVTVTTAFESVCHKLFGRAHAGERESVALAALRDALLPQLMSGALRVSQADKLVAQAI